MKAKGITPSRLGFTNGTSFSVPVTDVAGWIRASFDPAEHVVLKVDIEVRKGIV